MCCCIKQVQEKKVKKISDMNIDPSMAVGNGGTSSSSISSSSRSFLANGGYPDRSYNSLSNDMTFPPGGISSLRLLVVVVLTQSAHFFLEIIELIAQYSCIVVKVSFNYVFFYLP